MRSPPPRSPAAGGGDAESLFRTKPIPEIRAVEAATRSEIESKKEELRQLVGRSYRDLIDSADSILLIKSSSESISSHLASIESALSSLSSTDEKSNTQKLAPNPTRSLVYGVASRVKYLVDTPESIWGCLDESMLHESSGRYLRAKVVHGLLQSSDLDVPAKFPLLRHQWQIVESFRAQISQRSRDRLTERGLPVTAYADALAAAATIDDLNPKQVLALFLDSTRSWISQKIAGSLSDSDSCSAVLCDVARTIMSSLGQVGQLFVLSSNEMPLFYKTVLGSPPGTQLFGGIPNPEKEVRMWKSHREKLESVIVLLEPEYVASTCSGWLKACCDEIFGELSGGKELIGAIGSGEGLASAEKVVREALDGREQMEESLEQWLKSVFGSEIESPWNQISGLILKEGKDILENRLEEAFMKRMKEIMHSEFENLSGGIKLRDSIEAIVANADPNNVYDFHAYLKKASNGGAVWFSEKTNQKKAGILANLKPTTDEYDFRTCLNSYFGPEVSRIRDAVDNKCRSILEDLLSFVESSNSALRLRELVPYIQEKCFKTISMISKELEVELGKLSASLGSFKDNKISLTPSVIVERSLFIGRLLFALRNHSSHIPLLLGSPRQWVKETAGTTFANLSSPLSRKSKIAFDSPVSFTPRRHVFDSPRGSKRQNFDGHRRQTIAAAAALFGADDNSNPRLDELNKTLLELCIKAHSLWISWVSDELSIILSKNLNKDDSLSTSTPLRGWEVTVIKQEESSEGPLEMQIALPSMPSIYITSFLFQACLEIHKVGGHILDKIILQNFARNLLEKAVAIYESFFVTIESGECRVTEKGVLQILLDLRFFADVLCGGKDSGSITPETKTKGEQTKSATLRPPFRWKPSQLQAGSASIEPVTKLISKLSQRLDPIDWATYEAYLWENEKQSYKRYAVLFGFLVQLNRLYMDTVQKLPTKSNTDSNIMRCSQVPRFKYLPISAPALTSRPANKSSLQTLSDESSPSPRGPWSTYPNGEQSLKSGFDENPSFGVATPLFKSLMTQVGSRFGESTSRWGSMLSDGPAAGLLSSFTSGPRFDA
ncbi:conserved oligomeric Golgi complex subunit 1 [Typha angustifolia]|uniref:conserved oligomeric Golgi complex subunit 1 n=1 Tax=Typha angustifolia TaxID=59011 RepID=UPI003C2B09FE